MTSEPKFHWPHVQSCKSIMYTCGYCDREVASASGFETRIPASAGGSALPTIRICPHCVMPTTFRAGRQIPGLPPGNAVHHVPENVNALYEEARRSAAANAPTAAVLACRKLLMNIAVALGAESGKPFVSYVDYLASKGYVPPNGKDWVDHIRKKGNEANHEIPHMTAEDADDLISFSEMLLKFIYEFPNKVPKIPKVL